MTTRQPFIGSIFGHYKIYVSPVSSHHASIIRQLLSVTHANEYDFARNLGYQRLGLLMNSPGFTKVTMAIKYSSYTAIIIKLTSKCCVTFSCLQEQTIDSNGMK